MDPLVQNEQTKLLATAVNNLGVASLQVDDPLRLACFVIIWVVVGGMLLLSARRLLRRLS